MDSFHWCRFLAVCFLWCSFHCDAVQFPSWHLAVEGQPLQAHQDSLVALVSLVATCGFKSHLLRRKGGLDLGGLVFCVDQ